MNKPLVTIGVLTYNDEVFVIRTLESVKSQTYDNIELIISDDCSTDRTVDLCKNWLKVNSRFFTSTSLLTSENNGGVTNNCNRIEKKAKGEWTKLIGGDDLLREDCIVKFVDFISKNADAKIVQCRLLLINQEDSVIGTRMKGPNPYFHSDRITAGFQHEILLRTDPVDALGLFKNRKMMEEIDYYDTDFPMQEDTPFSMKVTSMGIKIYWIDDALVKRRMRPGTLSGVNDRFLFVKNDVIRIDINKKYFAPYLNGLELWLLRYNDSITRLFYENNIINRKNCINKILLKLLKLPVILIRKRKLNSIYKEINC